ncbi:MAG TPA: hypothetical protein VFI29_17605, partial [Hanamia sp.]|nr:hypothetical protein [Hanamia sp.]
SNNYVSPEQQNINNTRTNDAGYNLDNTKKGWLKLAENKTWNNFANNIALPTITAAATEGSFKLGGAILKSFYGDIEYAIQSAANEAKIITGKGSGPVYGTNVHTAFKEQINLLQKQGLSVSPEVSYLDGIRVNYGTPGSVRADVVVGDIDNPSAIFDLKTGKAKLTPAEITKYKANLPKSVKTIKEIKPK